MMVRRKAICSAVNLKLLTSRRHSSSPQKIVYSPPCSQNQKQSVSEDLAITRNGGIAKGTHERVFAEEEVERRAICAHPGKLRATGGQVSALRDGAQRG